MEDKDKHVFGADRWWQGIVEHRNLNDPRKIGTCKVRIFGIHTADKSLLPTEQLPDAYPAESLSVSIFSTPKEGDTVMGIFLDENKQVPMMLFKIPTVEQREVTIPSEGDGFKDARTDSELASNPRPPQHVSYNPEQPSEVQEYASAFRYPAFAGSPSIPFLSRNEFLPQTMSPQTRKAQAQATRFATSRGDTWFELPTAYAAVYPFNHVYESESFHVLEFDDTFGAERVHLRHRVGSGFEYFPDGSYVEKIVRDKYTITLGDDRIGISGSSHKHVRKDLTLYVEGDVTTHIGGDYNLVVDGDYKRIVKGDIVTNTYGDFKNDVKGEYIHKAGGTLYLQGSSIHENSSSTPDVEEITDFDLPSLPAETLSAENQASLLEHTGSSIAAEDDDEVQRAGITGEPTVNVVAVTPITCPTLEEPQKAFGNGDNRYRMSLSQNYQLGDLCIRCTYPHHVAAQNGLDQSAIVCNLAFLATNILDKIAVKYPGFQINSGFRKSASGTSQHEKGEAVDLQWPSIRVGNLSKYMDIANWIRNNVPFDQLILEHGNTIWLHISLKRSGGNRGQVLTMKNGAYTPGLSLFGRT